MTDGTRSQAWLFWLALGLSLAIHVGVAAHLLLREPRDFGATDIPTTAISVNIASSDILESIEQSEASEAAASPSSTAGEPIPPQEAEPEKAETPPPPAETEKAKTPPPIETPPPPQTEITEAEAEKEALRRSELDAQQEQQRIAEEALQRAAEAEREKLAAEAEREKQAAEAERKKQAAEQQARDKARQLAEEQDAREEREAEAREAHRERQAAERKKAEREARKKSGDQVSSAGASGSKGAKTAAGRVSASQGAAARQYSDIVNAWIARNKPSSAGARGRVVVELAISTSGQLTFARIVSSSGNQSLDQIALATVRRSSPFPQPPPGSTPAQLRFTFPFSSN
jgi:TolA protein